MREITPGEVYPAVRLAAQVPMVTRWDVYHALGTMRLNKAVKNVPWSMKQHVWTVTKCPRGSRPGVRLVSPIGTAAPPLVG